MTIGVARDSNFDPSEDGIEDAPGTDDQNDLQEESVTLSLAVAAFSDPDNPEDE